jgi:hypothetical protein
MRYYNNGAGYTVSYSARDAAAFAARWPCSTVRGHGAFAFLANGDLCDATGSATQGDGPDWLAFSADCQAYADTRRQTTHTADRRDTLAPPLPPTH